MGWDHGDRNPWGNGRAYADELKRTTARSTSEEWVGIHRGDRGEEQGECRRQEPKGGANPPGRTLRGETPRRVQELNKEE